MSWLVGPFPQKHHHARMDPVAQSPEGTKPFFANFDEARRVFECPVEPLCFSRESRALVARFVAYRKDEVKALSIKLSERLGPLRRDIHADLIPDTDGLGADAAGMRTRGIDFIEFAGLMAKKRLGDLTPDRVPRANDQYTLLIHVES